MRLFSQNGYTLLELLITLGVLAITVAVAVPGFNATINNSRRTTAVNNMASTLHIARSEAITRGTRITICPTINGDNCAATDWSSGWLFFADNDSDQIVDVDETILGVMAPAPRMDISSAEFPNFLMYRPNGRIMVGDPNTNIGQWTFCDPRGAEHARIITINSSGQSRLSTHHANGGLPSCP